MKRLALVLALLGVVVVGGVGLTLVHQSQQPPWFTLAHSGLDCVTADMQADTDHRAGRNLDASPGPCLPR